jgi:hypothetical protein
MECRVWSPTKPCNHPQPDSTNNHHTGFGTAPTSAFYLNFDFWIFTSKIAERECNGLVRASRVWAGPQNPETFFLREWLTFHSLKARDILHRVFYAKFGIRPREERARGRDHSPAACPLSTHQCAIPLMPQPRHRFARRMNWGKVMFICVSNHRSPVLQVWRFCSSQDLQYP